MIAGWTSCLLILYGGEKLRNCYFQPCLPKIASLCQINLRGRWDEDHVTVGVKFGGNYLSWGLV